MLGKYRSYRTRKDGSPPKVNSYFSVFFPGGYLSGEGVMGDSHINDWDIFFSSSFGGIYSCFESLINKSNANQYF